MTTSFYEPTTLTQRARALRSENTRLKRQLAAYQEWAPDPDTLALIVAQSEANKRLYRACLARNVILNRKLRQQNG